MNNNYNLDLSIISKELRLLLEILSAENNLNRVSSENELFTDIDWDEFLRLARHHRVYPLIYSKIKNIDEALIPLEIIQTFYQEYKTNTYQMLQLSGEMGQVSKLFSENQIRLLFLKGPVIAADIYGDISLRNSKDLDILIPITDLKKAEEILLNNGYEREGISAFDDWKWMKHHVSYFHPLKKVHIEIHWRLHPPPAKEPKFSELWKRKRVSTIASYPIYFLGKEDLVLYLMAHGARHGWFRLRWLVDIDQIIRKGTVLENNNLLTKYHLQHHFFRQALILTSQLLDTPINKEMQKFTTGKHSKKSAQMAILYIVEMGYLHINHNNVVGEPNSNSLMLNLQESFMNRYLFSMKSNLQKLIFVVQLFYPSSDDAMTLKLPKPFRFLYFPLRPFLWIWRKTRKS
ncbi:nucleotidyltransferase family protein [Peribacillus butanolivorans]|uniref:nucleotidyltransferase domain-containing protein n=1 Tax=Peribacillus butanolivorans TaxID=421767 RepID=UPI0035DE77CB